MENSARDSARDAAATFASFITQAAMKAGYDIRPRAGGRKQLAEATGISVSAIGRTLDGKTLPLPSQMEHLAKAVGVPVLEMLVRGGVISGEHLNKSPDRHVASASLTPEAAADAWGITNPIVRKVLLGQIEQAILLQAEMGAGGVDAVSRG
ncbi:multiprotein-bridging factor 1 family protein [Streptomyces sp. NPDC092952]|uniref:helix-turn-helix domain-containing protein n=1 Tax=Streptomyces sp. NPDC092952 TaxID=3366018 RepID=UPI0037F398D1